MNVKALKITDMKSFAELFAEILEDQGSEIVSAKKSKIVELNEMIFSFSSADRTLRGPYSYLMDLIREEGAEVYSEYWDGHGPASSGSNEVYEWKGHYLVHLDASGWSESVYSSLSDAIHTEDLRVIGDAHQSVNSSELSYEELIHVLEVHPYIDPPASLLVNGEVWVPEKN